jgi:hypothetical protein
MKQNTHTLTDEQLTKLLDNDPDTVAFIRTLVDPPRVKKWGELRGVKGYWVDGGSNVKEHDEGGVINGNRNVFSTKPQAIGYGIAAAKLTQVVEDARRGWVPKWDGVQDNWCVFSDRGNLIVSDVSCIKSPFALPTRELAEQLLKTCREDLEAFYAAVGS